MPAPTSSNPQPPSPKRSNKDLLIPWLLVVGLFTISLIAAVATLLSGMTRVGIEKASLPWWYRPLLATSECGLALSAAGILALVIVSISRASRTQ